MRTTSLVFLGLGVLLAPFAVIYWIGSSEASGNVLFGGLLVSLWSVAVFAYAVSGRYRTPAEDRPDALPSEGAGVIGSFPSRSVWPITLAGAAGLLGYGLAFNAWLALPGAALVLLACIGLAMETRPQA